jgi:hypothetical protein
MCGERQTHAQYAQNLFLDGALVAVRVQPDRDLACAADDKALASCEACDGVVGESEQEGGRECVCVRVRERVCDCVIV